VEEDQAKVKYRFFTVPIHAPEPVQEELNRFCAEQRVVSVDKQFVQGAEGSFWALCVCYLDQSQGGPVSARGKDKIDYREVLNESDFALFAKLRGLRKTLAEQEGVPAYALFTNEQLAVMVRNRVTSKAALGDIEGVGPARVEKYGDAFLKLLEEAVRDAVESSNGNKTP
jgi:superfamily II DNA helicase RecQ